ncbi:MAG: mechanosensitive ion channel family protein [Chloroherpetonaceae bacterium]|nr:mechanosensitive ion channel family protein [Chloroherpetonaceae bacterium]
MESLNLFLEQWNTSLEANPLLFGIVRAVLILVVSYPIAIGLKLILALSHKLIFAKTDTNIDDKIVTILKDHAAAFCFVLALKYALMEFQLALPETSKRTNDAIEVLRHIAFIGLVFVAARVIGKIIREGVDWYLHNLPSHLESKQIASIAPFIRRGLQLVSIAIVLVIVLDHFDINIGSLLVSLGVGSLAVALAAQDTLANIIAGIIIAVDKPFRVGDRVQLFDGKIGDIHEIGLRSTKIKDFDNNLVILPNAELIRSRIINFAYPNDPIRVLVLFSVAYGTDLSKVREIVLKLATAAPDYSDAFPSGMQVMDLQDSGVLCRLETFVTDFTKRFDTEVMLREQIHTELCNAGIAFALPRRVLLFPEKGDEGRGTDLTLVMKQPPSAP